MASTPEKRVQELHLTLPPAPKPVAVYKTAVKFGNLLFVSGHGPLRADKTLITGRVGLDGVKQAFADDELRKQVWLTPANSINLGRLLPQVFYYFLLTKLGANDSKIEMGKGL